MIHLAHLGPGPASLTLQKLLRTPMQASSEPPCLCSLLSGCASPMAPVLLHSQQRHLLDTHLVISQCVSLLTWVTGSSCLCPPSTSRSQWRAGDPPCHTPCTQVTRPWSPVSSVMLCYLKLHFLPPVQMQGTSSSLSTRFTQSFSALVSMLMESIQNSLHTKITEKYNLEYNLYNTCNSFWPPPSPSWCPGPQPARRNDTICQIGSRGQSLESSKVQFEFENLTDW